jgi:hypothetical protein
MEKIMSQRNESSLYSLAQRETIALADRRSFNLICTAGELWITADSLAGDHLLKAGEQMTLSSHTRVVVSALKAAEMRVSPCCGSAPVRRLASRCTAHILDRIRRWQATPLSAYPATLIR